jgi:hypothetical protein
LGAGVAHLEQTLSAVVAHSGHDYAYGVRSNGLSNRAEEHVDAGPVAGDEWPVCDLSDAGGTGLAHEKVMISRSDEGAP